MNYPPIISQAAFDETVDEEVSSAAYYTAHYQGVDFPGGASGPTIGVGYDLGYASPEEFDADWGGRLPDDQLQILRGCLGLRGAAAQQKAHELRGQITVTWDVALAVFERRDVPRWTATVQSALPNTDQINGDCFGAIFSLTFNRGASFGANGDRYTEMRAIKAHMSACEFEKIPAEFRSMKRLWPEGTAVHADLTARREHEAVLFEKGLAEMKAGTSVVLINVPADAVPVAPHSVNATPEIAPHPGSSGEFWTGLLNSGNYKL